MAAATLLDLTDDFYFGRNLIAGRWAFPAAPYEFDIRSPSTSDVLGTVPLSSWRDVATARDAARAALGEWADGAARLEVLKGFVELLATHAAQLTAIQAWETGLHPDDSRDLVLGATNLAAGLTVRAAARPAVGVTGHVLATGSPMLEMVAATVAALAAGDAVVAKPSLRAPLTVIAVTRLLEAAGPPDGVINLVHGTGIDVGAAMIADAGFDQVQVRGRPAWTRHVAGQRARLGCPAPWVFNGSANSLVVGPGYDEAVVRTTIRSGLRANSAGGPLHLGCVAAQADVFDEVCDIAADTAHDLECAPLSTMRHRDAAVATVAESGGQVLTSLDVPDDRRHRMGWHLPPLVVAFPASGAPALGDVAGPVLRVHQWRTPADVGALFDYRTAAGITVASGETAGIGRTVAGQHQDISSQVRCGVLPAGWSPEPPVHPGSERLNG